MTRDGLESEVTTQKDTSTDMDLYTQDHRQNKQHRKILVCITPGTAHSRADIEKQIRTRLCSGRVLRSVLYCIEALLIYHNTSIDDEHARHMEH